MKRERSSLLKPSLNWLLVFVPAALAIRIWPHLASETVLFACACLAIVPLARLMGCATEALARRMGHGAGGLLNATFGNAAEMTIGLMALSKGLITIVKASIIGSIIGNVLLVMGCSALAGGLKFREQHFNKTAARALVSALTLAAFALMIPALFHATAAKRPGGWNRATEDKLALAIAIVLFVCYVCVLLFELVTHRHLYVGRPRDEEADDEMTEAWSTRKALLILIVSTAVVALMSEFLAGAVEGARTALGVTEVFIGVIVVAIIGNAAEHSTAIWMAMKNKMSISLSIAVGSSLQIALFVAPVLLFVSYFFGRPLDLEFSIPEVLAVIVAVIFFFQISGDGQTNWIEGVQLLSVYIILAILFFFLPAAAFHH